MRPVSIAILCFGLLIVAAITHEIIFIRMNVAKVDRLCAQSLQPEIRDKERWKDWNVELERQAHVLKIDWQSDFSDKRAYVMKFSEHYGVYIASSTGEPLAYPYLNVRAVKNDLYYRGKLIASSVNYSTYSDVGFLLAAISGGGKVYGCKDKTGASRSSEFQPALSAYTIPVRKEIALRHGDWK